MQNHVAETLATLLRELQKYGTTESVIGKEVQVGDVTIVPVTKISVGVGAGGGAQDKKPDEKSGGGGGGGVRVEPVAFLVIQKGQVSLLNIGKKGSLDTLSEQIPALLNKWIDKKHTAKDKKGEAEGKAKGPEKARGEGKNEL